VAELARSVLQYVRQNHLIRAGDRVSVAVSGGADSVALLRLLLDLRHELGIVLSVVHFNHQLRGHESDDDERFVAALAERHGLEFFCDRADVKAHAQSKCLGLEAAARALRYECFRRLLRDGVINHLATAHTLDDQAETVLLRVVRGSGSRGLAGIYPMLRLAGETETADRSIIRPLLATRRIEIELYLKGIAQDWREDASNRDLRHARNRVRHGILPRLESNFNPAVRVALAETAEIAQAEEEYWGRHISRLLPDLWKVPDAAGADRLAGQLSCDLPESLAVRRRIVLAAADRIGLKLEFKHVKEILQLAASPGPSGTATLPHGWSVRRERDLLEFAPPFAGAEAKDYEYSLTVPGLVEVLEIRTRFEAIIANRDNAVALDMSLDASMVGGSLIVRNWRTGDRFWPAQTKSSKKIKELLTEKHVTGTQKRLWPVLTSGAQVVWMRGFKTPRAFQPAAGAKKIVMIREVPML
jgi:tRNA(Ile)-lysidine synthase